MKPSLTLAMCAALIATSAAPLFAATKTAAEYIATAPFKMNMPAEPVIPVRTFNIADYGAIPDGQTLNTAAFAKAIAAIQTAGGGRLVVPQGLWLTGPIMLCSNLDFHVEPGALVLFTPDRTQYPIINMAAKEDKKVNYDVQPPLYGKNLDNIAITGGGTFDGSGESWRPVKKEKTTESQWRDLVASGGVVVGSGKNDNKSIWYPSAEARDGEKYLAQLGKKAASDPKAYLPARDFLRPKLLVLSDCNKVLLDGPTFKNSPKFVVNPQGCRDVIIRNINVNNEWWAQNGDGIDLSACKGALIYNCRVTCGDDGICMKSSGNGSEAALQNIVIAACTVYHAHGGFVVGSNTNGGMKNIYVVDCTYIDTNIGIRIKSADDRGGLVRDIYIQDIVMHNIATEAILFDSFYNNHKGGGDLKQPEFCHFSVKNVMCYGARQAIKVNASKESPTHDLYFENVTISARNGVSLHNAKNIEFNKVNVITPAKPAVETENVENFVVRK